jgi:hypothetical protein
MEFEFVFDSVQNWLRHEYVSLIYLSRKYAGGVFSVIYVKIKKLDLFSQWHNNNNNPLVETSSHSFLTW